MIQVNNIAVLLPVIFLAMIMITVQQYNKHITNVYDVSITNQEQHEITEFVKQSNEVVQQVVKNVKTINPRHLRCLADNIYWEAKNENYQGKLAVARVVMNRIKHGFGSDPCSVIYASSIKTFTDDTIQRICQFSWVCEGKSNPPNNTHYAQSEEIARLVLLDNLGVEMFPNNMLYFHSITVDPQWPYKKLKQIGNHIFYSNIKKKESNNEQK